MGVVLQAHFPLFPRLGCLSAIMSESPFLRLIDIPLFMQCKCVVGPLGVWLSRCVLPLHSLGHTGGRHGGAVL